MCGRYFLSKDFRELVQQLFRQMGVAGETARPDLFEARDVFPSQRPPVICGQTSGLLATPMTWGFTNPARSGLLINARSESVWTKPTFADSVAERRCLIPASGFYEWDRYKARFRFTDPTNELLLLAGIYHEEQGKPHYTILTTQANESMQRVHDRMPVMISREEITPWLNDNERLTGFLERPQIQLRCEQDSGQMRMDFGFE